MSHILYKRIAVCTLAAALIMGFAYYVVAAPSQNDSLFCVDVRTHTGEVVQISAPPVLLGTLFDVMPSEIKRICQELELTPEAILVELETLQGADLVRIEGENNVRVWLEPVTPENQKDLGFIKVRVKEGRENGHVVNVNLPCGLVQLAGRVIKQLGLVDHFVEIPDEIKAISVKTANE